MWCNLSDYIQVINVIIGLFAIVIAGWGLRLWRIQLRGGDLYKYARDTLYELRQLLNLIDNFRYIFNSEEQENEIWLKIQAQYSVYESKLLSITILTKNKIDDNINGKSIKGYLTIIYKSRVEKYYLLEKHRRNEILEDERKETSKKLIELDYILKSRKEPDIFGNELNEYYELMCNRLKKYIKLKF